MEKENLFKLMDNIMKEIGSREKGNKIKKKNKWNFYFAKLINI
jgi:hypothetical protein